MGHEYAVGNVRIGFGEGVGVLDVFCVIPRLAKRGMYCQVLHSAYSSYNLN
jgi:hypothetical protein